MAGPLSPAIPLISAGVSAIGSLFGQGASNRARRREQERARQHDIDMWNKQNQYNHPTQQMGRLRDAGLNPNLIYGTSPSSAVGASSPLPAAKAAEQDWNVDLNPLTQMMQYASVKNTEAQTNNLGVQSDVMRQDELLKSAQSAGQLMKTSRDKFELGVAKELRSNSLEMARAQLTNTKQDIVGKHLTNYFNDKTMADRVTAVGLGIDNARATLTGTQLSNAMKQYETELNNLGLTRNDPLYQRLIMSGKFRNVGKSVFDNMTDLFTRGMNAIIPPDMPRWK